MFAFALIVPFLTACRGSHVGEELARTGDEIVVAGRLFHTGTPVVLWMDPGGFDAYRVERRFVPWEQAAWEKTVAIKNGPKTPNRYGTRFAEPSKLTGDQLTPDELSRLRGGGWSLDELQQRVDQFVYHYDVCGTSQQCFNILHDHRGLSIHFMLDVDGTIYQTLDLKERAWHATTSNDRSIGIEIANIGAYSPKAVDAGSSPLSRWYTTDDFGTTSLVLSERQLATIRKPPVMGSFHPARNQLIIGTIQSEQLAQYDFTPEQYAALAKLTAAVCRVLPGIRCDAPRNESGAILNSKMPDETLKTYQGLLGHYHLQSDKTDPGPAFNWPWLLEETRRELQR